jgi:hypothetical protein
MRTLLTRGLVEEAGTEPESGAVLHRTSAGRPATTERFGCRATWQPWTLIDFVREG